VDLVTIDLSVCVRCAGCSIIAPAVFSVSRKGSHVLRQPEDAIERTAARAAALVCPTRAIQIASVP
jgi:ferredoxin